MADDMQVPDGSAAVDEENRGDAMANKGLDTVNDDPMAEDVTEENIEDDDDFGPGVDDEELDEDELDEDEEEEES